MINVLFLQPTLQVGGAERVLFDLAANLDRARFDVRVACCYDIGVTGRRLQQRGVPVYHNLFRSQWDVNGLRRLVHLCRRGRFDVLYVQEHPLTMLWGRVAGRLAGIRKNVLAIHVTRAAEGEWKRAALNRLISFDAIVALSAEHQSYLKRNEGLPAERIRVIHNGIDPAPYLEARRLQERPDGLPEGVPLVGIVAMLRPEKRHDVFLRAAASIIDQTEAHFVVIGDGPERDAAEFFVADLGLKRRVHFLGRRDDVPRLVSSMDVVVLSSDPLVETFPISIMEAMAAGKPAVCTRVGSLPELVADGETGLLVPHGDPEQLGAAILKLLKDPSTAAQMGRAGQRRLMEQFTLDRMIRENEDLLEGLMAK